MTGHFDDELFPWEDTPAVDAGKGADAERPQQAAADPPAAEPEQDAPAAAVHDVPAAEPEEYAHDAAVHDAPVVEPEHDTPAAEPDAAQRAAAAASADTGSTTLTRSAGRQDAVQRTLVRKEYYSISEVSDLVGLPAHVLRYWESQFSVLNPSKNRSGNRVYQRKEIKLILLVKQLLHEEKYTVEGAKQKLDQLRRGGGIGEATRAALDEQLVRVLREDLLALSELLKVEDE